MVVWGNHNTQLAPEHMDPSLGSCVTGQGIRRIYTVLETQGGLSVQRIHSQIEEHKDCIEEGIDHMEGMELGVEEHLHSYLFPHFFLSGCFQTNQVSYQGCSLIAHLIFVVGLEVVLNDGSRKCLEETVAAEAVLVDAVEVQEVEYDYFVFVDHWQCNDISNLSLL